MNDIDNLAKEPQNKGNDKKKKNITDRTKSSITKSLSQPKVTLDQKMDKLTDGMQNMMNGVTQVIELFKEMMKGQIELSTTLNKFIAKEAERWEEKDITKTLEKQKKNIKSDYFRQSLELAIRAKDITKYSYELLKWAIWENNKDIFQLLLQHPEIDINFQNDKNWNTVLMDEIVKWNNEMIKILLKQPSININTQNYKKQTTLMLAIDTWNTDTIETILSHPKINLNLQDTNENTALLWAMDKENSIIEMLIKQPDIDINIQNNRWVSALMMASSRGNSEIIKLLLNQQNIDLNLKDDDGDTALMRAIEKQKTEIAKLLINHPSINLNIQNEMWRTALKRAIKQWNTEIENMLK